jgi:type II secretory ATPase GspE/PulE/Tfp pilus assembly ATPase PilB-like protein
MLLDKFFKKTEAPQKSVDSPNQQRPQPAPVAQVPARRPQQPGGVPLPGSVPVAGQIAVNNRGLHKTASAPVQVNGMRVQPPAASVRQRVREADKDVVNFLIEGKDLKILTGVNGVVRISEDQAQYIALVSHEKDGVSQNILVVARDYAKVPETQTVRILLQRKGYSFGIEYLVDLSVIKQLYDRTQGNVKVRGDVAQMQRRFVELVTEAAHKRCSDIHLLFDSQGGIIRVRSDNVMMKLTDLSTGEASALCQAAFAMCEASDSTYNPQQYQGARMTDTSVKAKGLTMPNGVQSLRLQFNPLSQGRYLVVRLLYAQKIGSNEDVDTLGYAPNHVRDIKLMRRRKEGIIIISGPTGSGKSTTLQRALAATYRERPGLNIITIEDPPEYVIPGAAQLVVVNATTAEERSEKFRQAITASLRSDPNIIMIGEIRDTASALLAFEAAMTGHVAWASLHANDAISNLDRLRDKHVEIWKLTDAKLVAGLIGQRLLRRTVMEKALTFDQACEAGLVSDALREHLPKLAGDYLSHVRFAGEKRYDERSGEWKVIDDINDAYRGRTVCAETIRPNQKFLDLYKEEKKSEAIDYWFEHLNGMTMREHGLTKILKGEVCPNEVDYELGDLTEIDPRRVPIIMAYVAG